MGLKVFYAVIIYQFDVRLLFDDKIVVLSIFNLQLSFFLVNESFN